MNMSHWFTHKSPTLSSKCY